MIGGGQVDSKGNFGFNVLNIKDKGNVVRLNYNNKKANAPIKIKINTESMRSNTDGHVTLHFSQRNRN